jgi:hypothetical protein
MFIVICGHSRRISLVLHAKFPGHCKFFVFAMSRLDSAGEFPVRGIKNNGGPQIAQTNPL